MLKKIILFILITFSVSILLSQEPENKENANKAIERNTTLITQNADLIEVFGPVLPIALSPFFGVTLTSLASVLAAEGVFENEFLATHPVLSNWYVFSIFLILTILTALPRYTKITGQLGLFIAKIEDYAGLIILLIIQITPSIFNPIQAEQTTVYQAGMIDFSYASLIATLSVINMYVIKVVRYFFDLLIYVSPIPAIDAAFDTIKKSFIIFLILVYAINPVVAFVINVIFFITSAIMFRWVNRRAVYFENIYVNPLKAKILKRYPSLVDENLPRKIAQKHDFLQFAIKAFPLQRMGTFKRKMKCWLISDNNSLFLYKNRFLLKPRVLDLNKYTQPINIGKDIFWFRIEEPEKFYRLKLDISNEYKPHYETIKEIAQFNDLGEVGAKGMYKKAKNAVKNKTIQLYDKIKKLGEGENPPAIEKT